MVARQLRPVVLTLVIFGMTSWSTVAAEPVWQPVGSSPIGGNTRVFGDVEVLEVPSDGGWRVRGWVVDAFSATRPDQIHLDDLAGRRLAEVNIGGFERRADVAARFGSSAYALSGFDLALPDAPTTLIVRAHLGQLGWWQTTVSTPSPRRARVTRFERMSPDLVEVEVASAEPFPVRNALTEMAIGDVVLWSSRYPDNGDTHSLIFSMSSEQLSAISADNWAVVRYNPSNGQDVWEIGRIDPGAAEGCQTVE